jgi:hypothetical protein
MPSLSTETVTCFVALRASDGFAAQPLKPADKISPIATHEAILARTN